MRHWSTGKKHLSIPVLIRFISAILAIGCATYSTSSNDGAEQHVSTATDSVPKNHGSSLSNVQIEDDNSGAVIGDLWKSRAAGDDANATTTHNFTFGPGDLLRVSVPQIEQLKDRTVRVSEDGTIALPLLGVINVAGLTEQDLRNDLIRRVAKYMYHPQVEVFLQHTENRQVAVLGSVKKPGRYMLASRTDSIMTMISRAGGLNDDASSRIMLFPAPRPEEHQTGPVTDVHSDENATEH